MASIISSDRLRQLRPLGFVLLLSMVLASWCYPELLPFAPRLVSDSGDAVKTIYSLVYYVQHGGGNFSAAMLYPYGEHINYYDLIPLVALVLRGIHLVVPLSAPTIIAGMNLALFLALVLTPVVLLVVMRRLGLPVWVAIPAALILTFLSPQQARLTGHPSLFAPVVVPALWYMFMRVLEQPKRWRWTLLYVLVAVGAALLHTYFLLLSGLLAGVGALVLFVQQPAPYARQRLLPLLLSAAAPLALFRIWLALTDHVTDRPPNPYGVFVFVSKLDSIFLPSQGFWHDQIDRVYHWNVGEWEGLAYVGIPGLVVLVLSVVRLGQRLLRRQWRRLLHPALPVSLSAVLVAGVAGLLLAMAYPFSLPGGEALLVGPIKQFRALGRMAWLFYYAYTVYAVYYLYQVYRCLARRRQLVLGAALLSVLGLIWISEAVIQVLPGRTSLAQQMPASTYGNDEYTNLLTQLHRQPSDFQAILPLPWFCIGTDKILIEVHGGLLREASRAIISTGLPEAAAMLTRTSVSRSLSLAQLVGNPLLPRPLASQLPSRKPLLVVVLRGAWLAPGQEDLLRRAIRIGSGWQTDLYELPVDSLRSLEPARTLAWLNQHHQDLRPAPNDPQQLLAGAGSVIHRSFDEHSANPGLLGPGALVSQGNPYKGHFTMLYDGPAPADTGHYEASVWVQATREQSLGNFQAKALDANDGLQGQISVELIGHSTDIYNGWVRIAIPVHVRADTRRLQLLVDNADLAADELLVRPVGTDVYSQRGSIWLKNNFPVTISR